MGSDWTSLPSRGAWIEISKQPIPGRVGRSLPSRGAWIDIPWRWTGTIRTSRSPHGERGLKYLIQQEKNAISTSLPSRGAWIEIR